LSEILINDDVVLGWDLRVKWARETAEAVHYLHNLNPRIIHRDLKADNILIDRNNTALVTDFGLSKAKVLNMMNPAGAPSAIRRREVGAHAKYKSFVEFSEVAGTPSYLAPELWRNESYTESVDVYSYGVVLWEILARDAPFRELDNEELMLALRDQNLRPTIPKWTPEAYKLLTERCWSGSPNARPSFDQILKLLKILEDKHMYSWPPPENMSLDEDTQREIVIAWGKEKEEKEQAIKAAERKLLAAQMQLKTAKSSGNSSMSQDGPLLSPTPIHHGDQQQQPLKRKKSPVQEVFLK
jgi:serine/threonine protein kinase